MISNPMTKIDINNNIISDGTSMTASGTTVKTAILLAIAVLSGYYTWVLCLGGYSDKVLYLTIAGLIGGLVMAVITIFKPNTSYITAPVYAICEGLTLGYVSYSFNTLYNGIVLQAVTLTVLVLFSMLFLYQTKLIKATDRLKRVVLVSTFAILIFYLVKIIAAFFGHPLDIFNGTPIGIGISIFICAVAALNFIVDFDFVETCERNAIPKYFEWYGAFALMVTLVWLYIELLNLLAQTRKQN